MASLANIRAGLAANLSTIDGWQISAYHLSSAVMPSLQVMGPEELSYDLAFGRGLDQWTMSIMAFAGLTTDVGAQKVLDTLLDTGSVKTALQTDKTLGGAARDLRVTDMQDYRAYVLGTTQVLGCKWNVAVWAAGT